MFDAGCPMEVATFYPEENQWMPERCGEVTYGKTFCIEHDTCRCGMPMSHNEACPPMDESAE